MDLNLIRKAIASEKARLVESIMRHNLSALSSIPNQQVSREPEREEAHPPVARVSIGSVTSDQQSSNNSNNSNEAKPSGIDQSEAVATPAIPTGHIESFPEVSLAISSSEKLFSNSRVLTFISPHYRYSTACWRKWKTLKSQVLYRSSLTDAPLLSTTLMPSSRRSSQGTWLPRILGILSSSNWPLSAFAESCLVPTLEHTIIACSCVVPQAFCFR
jgi:hypothetical protein